MRSELKDDFSNAARLIDKKDFLAAKEKLLHLAALDPTSVAILCTLGYVYWQMGWLPEAVDSFKHAIALAPTLEAVSLGLFHCLWQLDEREEALEEIKRFQSIADSSDYREIVKEINEGSDSKTDL